MILKLDHVTAVQKTVKDAAAASLHSSQGEEIKTRSTWESRVNTVGDGRNTITLCLMKLI